MSRPRHKQSTSAPTPAPNNAPPNENNIANADWLTWPGPVGKPAIHFVIVSAAATQTTQIIKRLRENRMGFMRIRTAGQGKP